MMLWVESDSRALVAKQEENVVLAICLVGYLCGLTDFSTETSSSL